MLVQIMAVVSGGFMYGLLTLSKKYLLPHLRPPTQSAFLSTSQSLADQNEQLEELLSQLSEQTKGLEERVEKEREDVEKVVEEVKEMVERVGGEETRWRDEMRAIREEVEELKGMVPKVRLDLFYQIYIPFLTNFEIGSNSTVNRETRSSSVIFPPRPPIRP
jgi:peroxin-14